MAAHVPQLADPLSSRVAYCDTIEEFAYLIWTKRSSKWSSSCSYPYMTARYCFILRHKAGHMPNRRSRASSSFSSLQRLQKSLVKRSLRLTFSLGQILRVVLPVYGTRPSVVGRVFYSTVNKVATGLQGDTQCCKCPRELNGSAKSGKFVRFAVPRNITMSLSITIFLSTLHLTLTLSLNQHKANWNINII